MSILKETIENKDSKRTILITVLLTVSLMLNFYLYFLREPLVMETKTEVIKRDTVVNTVRDFDTVYVANTVYRDRYVYDTLHIEDKVYIQDTLHSYAFSEKDYDLGISAVRLDSYKLDIHAKDTVTYVQTVNKTVYKPKANKIAIGVQGGYGYGFKSRQIEPYVGLGITINLFNK